MRDKLSQKFRILRALREGPVKATAFSLPNVIDDLAPVYRVAARIQELRDAGYQIETTVHPIGAATYTLISEPDLARDSDAPAHAGGPTSGTPAAGLGGPAAGNQTAIRSPLTTDTEAEAISARTVLPSAPQVASSVPSAGGDQLFNPDAPAPAAPRPHWQEQEAA